MAAETTRGDAMSGLGLGDSDDNSLKALDMILDVWEEGTESGIPPEMMAYAALYTALTDLVATFGEDNVAQLIDGLKPRLQRGEFTVYRSTQ